MISLSCNYLLIVFLLHQSTGELNLGPVTDETVWYFAWRIRRSISLDWPKLFCLKCLVSCLEAKTWEKKCIMFFAIFSTKKIKIFKISKKALVSPEILLFSTHMSNLVIKSSKLWPLFVPPWIQYGGYFS